MLAPRQGHCCRTGLQSLVVSGPKAGFTRCGMACAKWLDFGFQGNYTGAMTTRKPTRTRALRSAVDAGTAAVSPLGAHLGFWLRMVSNQVSGAFQRAVEAEGASVSEWVAMRHLLELPGATHGELVAALGMTKGAVSKIARGLEAKGLLTRIPSPLDARTETLQLTPAGRALVPRLAALADRNEEAFFGHLPPGERVALRDTMVQIARHHGLNEAPTE